MNESKFDQRLEEGAGRDIAKVDRMGTDKMAPLIIKYSLPAIAGLLVMALYGLVDGIFIGVGVGDAGIAATAVAMPFLTITMALNTLVGNGGNIVTSIRLGEGNHVEAERALGNTVMLMIFVYAVVLITCIPMCEPILYACGATEASFEYAKTYFIILTIGFIGAGMSGGIGNFIRTAGSPNYAMLVSIVSSVLNIVLDWFTVIVMGWGIAGAAWATVIAQTIGALMTIGFFMRKNASIHLRLRYFRPDGKLFLQIAKLGLAGFLMNALMAFTGVIINQLFVHYGDMEAVTGTGALAAMGAAGRVQQIFFQLIVGISMAAQPILGYNWGAKYLRRVRSCFWTSSNIGFVGLLVMMAIAEFLPEIMLSFFNLSPDVLSFAIFTMRSQMIFLPIAAYGIMSSVYFMATEQALKANILVLLRQLVLLVPFLFLCPVVLPMIFTWLSPTGAIVWAYPLVDIVSTAISMLMVMKDLGRLKVRIANGESRDDHEIKPEKGAAAA